MIESRWKLIRHDPQSSRATCSTVADLLLRDSVLDDDHHHHHLRLEDWGLGKAAAAAEGQLVVHENRMTHCCMIVGCIYTAFALADRSVDSDVVQNCCTAAADPLGYETAAPHGYHGGIFWSQISHMWQIFWQDSWWALHDSCSMIYLNCMSRASWSRQAYCSVVSLSDTASSQIHRIWPLHTRTSKRKSTNKLLIEASNRSKHFKTKHGRV